MVICFSIGTFYPKIDTFSRIVLIFVQFADEKNRYFFCAFCIVFADPPGIRVLYHELFKNRWNVIAYLPF